MASLSFDPQPATPRGHRPSTGGGGAKAWANEPRGSLVPRALSRAADGLEESRRLVCLALDPTRGFPPNPRASACEIARPDGPKVASAKP